MTEDQLKLFEGIRALGVHVTDKPWGALLYRPDPNGVSGPPHQMIEIHPDGKVSCWAEVGPSDTPQTMADEEISCDEIVGTLEEFTHITYRALINDELDEEDWLREDLIEFMIGQGWEVTHESALGHVRFANDHSRIYPSWFHAAKACIEVASS